MEREAYPSGSYYLSRTTTIRIGYKNLFVSLNQNPEKHTPPPVLGGK